MKVTMLGLLLAAALPAAYIDVPAGAILPGSSLEIARNSEEVGFDFITEGGFTVSGSAYFPGPGIAEPTRLGQAFNGPNGFATPDAWVSASQPFPRQNDRFTGFGFEIHGGLVIANGETMVSAPFTLTGSYFDAYSPEPPYYLAEFHGQGTVYYTVENCVFCEDPENEFIGTLARYEFALELVESPEPATWSLLLLGLGAGWIKRR